MFIKFINYLNKKSKMCCILCCCCNWCNTYSSKCIEITILILSFTSFTASMIGLCFVNKSHIGIEAYICLLIVISFSVILIISIILILVWRFRQTINNKRNFASSAFSKIGLVTTIFCLLFTGIWESMSITKFTSLNNPCQSVERSDIKIDNKTNLLIRRYRRILLTYEENKEEFCLENPNYKVNVVSTLEYIYLFVSASVLELILLVLLYFWYNDFRRIKYLVDGQLIDSNTKETKIKYNVKKANFNNNLMLYMQNNYVAHYDIYGRPIFNTIKRKSKTISINNSKKPINYKILKIKNENNVLNLNDKNKTKGKNNIEDFVYFENNNNNHNNQNLHSSERGMTNIYNLKISKNRNNNNNNNINNNNNLSISKNSSKTSINENNSLYNN